MQFLKFLFALTLTIHLTFSHIVSPTIRTGTFNALLRNRAEDILKDNNVAKIIGLDGLIRLQRRVFNRGSCDVRLCFALDGSKSLSTHEYNMQKDLVNIIASVASVGKATFSAVQYGLVNEVITLRTKDPKTFRSSIQGTVSKKSRYALLGAGLGFCLTNIKMGNEGDGRKIVLLGNGNVPSLLDGFMSNILAAVETEEILAVGVGINPNLKKLEEVTGGKSENVFSIRGRRDAEKTTDEIITKICSVI